MYLEKKRMLLKVKTVAVAYINANDLIELVILILPCSSNVYKKNLTTLSACI